MKVEAKYIEGKFRIVDANTGTLILHTKGNLAIDGGGHKDIATAIRQAKHINDWYAKQKRAHHRK